MKTTADRQVAVLCSVDDCGPLWEIKEFSDLKKGDIFKIIEPNGRYYKDENNCETWHATSCPYLQRTKNGSHTYAVQMEPTL
jgi:hypothetical protein